MKLGETHYLTIGFVVSLLAHATILFFLVLPSFYVNTPPEEKERSFKPLHVTFGEKGLSFERNLPVSDERESMPEPVEIIEEEDDGDDSSTEAAVKEELDKKGEATAANPVLRKRRLPVPHFSPDQGVDIGNKLQGEQQELSYEQLLPLWLERFKVYPKHLHDVRLHGRGVVFLTVNRDGRILLYKLKRSTGHIALDRALIQMVRDANPAIPFPEDYRPNDKTVSYEIEFRF